MAKLAEKTDPKLWEKEDGCQEGQEGWEGGAMVGAEGAASHPGIQEGGWRLQGCENS